MLTETRMMLLLGELLWIYTQGTWFTIVSKSLLCHLMIKSIRKQVSFFHIWQLFDWSWNNRKLKKSLLSLLQWSYWPESGCSSAGWAWGHCVQRPPPPSCSPPRKAEDLPGTRPVLWMCRPGWKTGAPLRAARHCENDGVAGENGTETEMGEERSGTGVSPHFSLTWGSDGCSNAHFDLTGKQSQWGSQIFVRSISFSNTNCSSLPCLGRFLMYMKSVSSSLSGDAQVKIN